jgi:thioredoxin reductase (NADPH)
MTDSDLGERTRELVVIGAGPTGIAIGAEAKKAGLDVLLIDRGPLVANLLDFPTFMGFFTTRDKLEIAGIPLAIPEDKPDRRQAIAYYQSVARRYDLKLALHEEVTSVRRRGEVLEILSRNEGQERTRTAHGVAVATGYFHNPRRLRVAGEDKPWVSYRYREPYAHFGDQVVVIGGGNSAAEAALDLWRNGARVTLVHRGPSVKDTVKYWLKPDIEHRVEEGSIEARFQSVVTAFGEQGVEIEGPHGKEILRADAAYILIGYLPDVALLRRCGIEVDTKSLVPVFDAETCETNVQGLYVAGTLQAGARTDLIFIENSRGHGQRIVRHLLGRLERRQKAGVGP